MPLESSQLDMQNHLRHYQLLVQELLKTEPEEKNIKLFMEQLGLKYTEKNIDRLTEVLAFNPRNKGNV